MRKPRSRYHHGDLHDAALDAAEKEIDARGPVAFSLERVAASLGVTPAALYRHYKNRDALLREMIWRTFLRFVEKVDAAALAPEGSEPILAIGRAYVLFAIENPGWFRVQFSRAGQQLSDRQAAAQPQYAEILRSELAKLFGLDDAKIQRWYLALWAYVHGVAAMAVEHVIPGLSDADRLGLANSQLATFLEGLHAAAERVSPSKEPSSPSARAAPPRTPKASSTRRRR